jgi:nucleotide-binding universal stress UspA family protein
VSTAVFGKRRRRLQQEDREDTATDVTAGTDSIPAEVAQGPFDGAADPEDGTSRLDLGSVRLPVPEGAQLQVEMDRNGPVRAVHLMTQLGQLTVTAFAAPRSGGLWEEVLGELRAQLRSDGADPRVQQGEWGREIVAVTEAATLRFLGVDGPRWMLRGVAAGSAEQAEPLAQLLRDVVGGTVVVRGAEPLPVRSPLPLQLPEPLAEQLGQAAQRQGRQVDEGGALPGTGGSE